MQGGQDGDFNPLGNDVGNGSASQPHLEGPKVHGNFFTVADVEKKIERRKFGGGTCEEMGQ